MVRYKKIPVIIDAVQLTEPSSVETLEGTMRGNVGDWRITGVKGEQYFIKDDIFKMTYELAERMRKMSKTRIKRCACKKNK